MTEPLMVLLVDDDPVDREVVRRAIKASPVKMELKEAATLSEARTQLTTRRYDVQIVDLRLPDGDGLDLIEVPGPDGRQVPCVVLTGAEDVEFGLAALDRGAQDFLEKGEPGSSLVKAIRFAVRRARAALAPERERRCVLRATVDGVAGAEAVVRDPASGVSHRIRSDNRAVLLFLLGRQLLDDRRANTPETDAGWMSDRDVVIGIWGRGGEHAGRNRLHVLVHRMRKELQDAGIDSDVVETRRNALRGRFAGVELT